MFLLTFGAAMIVIGLSAMILSVVFSALDLSWSVISTTFKVGLVLVTAPFIIGLLFVGIALILALFGFIVLL